MSEERGTLEALVGQLALLLSPLTSLTPEGAPVFFLELGLPLDEGDAAQIGGALGKVTTNLGSLIELGIEIERAVEDEDWSKVVEKAIAAIDRIAKLIDFVQLEGALGGLNLPGANALLASFSQRLLDYLLARYLTRATAVSQVLQLTGILERVDHNVGEFELAKPFYTTDHFHFGRIGGWLSNPGNQLAELYDWGKPGFDGKKLLAMLDRVAAELGLPSLYDAGGPVLDLVAVEVVPRTDLNPRGVQVRLKDALRKGALEFGARDWTFTLGLDANVAADTEIVVRPGSISVKPPDAAKVAGTVTAAYSYKREDGDPLTLLAIAGGSRITVEEIVASAGIKATANGQAAFEVGAELKRGHALITMENADGFLGEVLGGFKIENNFDLGVGISTTEGVHFHGSSTLEIQLASHISLGPIELLALTLSIGIDEGKFPIGLTTDIQATLGPLVAIVEGIGFALVFELMDGGNLGPVDLSAEFVPPKGVGLSLDVGVVKGGGYLFFDFEREEYGGALQLDIAGIVSAKAVGIITTRMPDGSKGFSLLIIISAEFSPAFQLGYGFTLIGVGGLLGLNRTVDLAVLREGVRTGAVNSIMFPSNVVENAPQIISDLRAVFPPAEGVFLIGPMAKLGWGTPTLISLSFGLIIEIPGNLAILGVLRIALPDEDVALVNIQINFVGTLDFDKGMLAFDASLYDSYILFMTLEGDMCVRFKWSSPAGFLISLGGFHPSFTPPVELEVPTMKRLAINILDTEVARIRVEVYFALTSNSVQLGARAEIYFGFDAFYVDGYLGFDCLFRFSPFYFEIAIECGVTLHVFGADLLSIHLHFSLSGPTPWRAWGTGSVTILFWEIEADFDITWGDSEDTTLPAIEALPPLLAELDDIANWRALPPPSSGGLWVALREVEAPADTLVLHPAGMLSVWQKFAPLGLTWERIGNQRPSDVERAVVTGARSATQLLTIAAVDDQFARAHFEDLSDAQKLSVPSFEPMQAGATFGLGAALAVGPAVTREIEYELVVLDKETPKRRAMAPIKGLYQTLLAGGAVKRAEASKATKRQLVPVPEEIIQGRGEQFTVASAIDNKPHSSMTFGSEALAQQYLAEQTVLAPNLALHVIPASEVNAA
jgi:hypothetical protein